MRLLLFFSTFLLFASSASAQSLVVKRVNNLGYVGVDTLHQSQAGYFISGKKLGKKLDSNKQKLWNSIMRAPASLGRRTQSKVCDRGTVVFKLKKDIHAQEKLFNACASGPEYGELISKINKLKSL